MLNVCKVKDEFRIPPLNCFERMFMWFKCTVCSRLLNVSSRTCWSVFDQRWMTILNVFMIVLDLCLVNTPGFCCCFFFFFVSFLLSKVLLCVDWMFSGDKLMNSTKSYYLCQEESLNEQKHFRFSFLFTVFTIESVHIIKQQSVYLSKCLYFSTYYKCMTHLL